MARLYVGVDAGGSGTRAVLANAAGELLATGSGGPSDHLGGKPGQRKLQAALTKAVKPLQNEIGNEEVTVHAGIRGLSIPGRRAAAEAELTRLLPRAAITVTTDASIAVAGGLGGGEGVAVLAGTGSIALARTKEGQEYRAGGYGYLVSDEGSGYWLGREAIAASLRALDGRGPPTLLAELITEATGQTEPRNLVGWLYGGQRQVQKLASLAPLISQAASTGDEVARTSLAKAGSALAELARSAAAQAWPGELPSDLRVARCGGVWAAGAFLVDPFNAALAQLLPQATSDAPLLPPVGGAVLLATGNTRSLAALKAACARQ